MRDERDDEKAGELGDSDQPPLAEEEPEPDSWVNDPPADELDDVELDDDDTVYFDGLDESELLDDSKLLDDECLEVDADDEIEPDDDWDEDEFAAEQEFYRALDERSEDDD